MAEANATFPRSTEKTSSASVMSSWSSKYSANSSISSLVPLSLLLFLLSSALRNVSAWLMNFSDSNALMREFTSCKSNRNLSYVSKGEYFNSSISRSILLKIKHGFNFSSHACRKTAWVWTQMPSHTSTSTNAPSESLAAVLTSEQKSTWPGESMTFIKVDWGAPCKEDDDEVYCNAIEADFMVIPRLCSCSRKSIIRKLPACFLLMKPLWEIRQSVNVVLPWSTCAKTHMFRICSVDFCFSARISTALSIFLSFLLSLLRRKTWKEKRATNKWQILLPFLPFSKI